LAPASSISPFSTSATANLFYAISIYHFALLAIAFAFVPVNEQPFSKFVMNFILFLSRPKVLLWLQLPLPSLNQAKLKEKMTRGKKKPSSSGRSQITTTTIISHSRYQMYPHSIRAKVESLSTTNQSVSPRQKVLPPTPINLQPLDQKYPQ
jgi:hypothetical protein